MTPEERARRVVHEYIRGSSGHGRLPVLIAEALVEVRNEALGEAADYADELGCPVAAIAIRELRGLKQ